jgi:hypothetical protein
MSMTYRHSIAILAAAALLLGVSPESAQADPKKTPGVTCTAGGMRSPPDFTQRPPGRADYHFSGVCTSREGESLGYRIDGTWTPNDTGGKANASEVYRVDRLSGASESFTAIVGWRCDADPWLHDTHCTRIGDNIPGAPAAFWEQFGRGAMPSSRRALSADQRSALLADYERANGRRPALKTRDTIIADKAFGIALPAPGTTRDPIRPARTRDDAALNPQPLPPEPDPTPVPARTPAASSTHAATSIIIVGGRPAEATQATKAPAAKKTGGG